MKPEISEKKIEPPFTEPEEVIDENLGLFKKINYFKASTIYMKAPCKLCASLVQDMHKRYEQIMCNPCAS